MYKDWNDNLKKEDIKNIVELVAQKNKVMVSDFYKSKKIGEVFCELPKLVQEEGSAYFTKMLLCLSGVLSKDMVQDISIYIKAIITIEKNKLSIDVWGEDFDNVNKYLNNENVVLKNNSQLLFNILKKDDENNFKYSIDSDVISAITMLGDNIRELSKKERNIFNISNESIIYLLDDKESWKVYNFANTSNLYRAARGKLSTEEYEEYFKKYVMSDDSSKIYNDLKIFETLLSYLMVDIKFNKSEPSLELIKFAHEKIYEKAVSKISNNNTQNVKLVTKDLFGNYLKNDNKNIGDYFKKGITRKEFEKILEVNVKDDKTIITVNDDLVFFKSLVNESNKYSKIMAIGELIKSERTYFNSYRLKEAVGFEITSRYIFERKKNIEKALEISENINIIYSIYKVMLNNISKNLERKVVIEQIEVNMLNEEKGLIEDILENSNTISKKTSKKVKF